jgi:hypothetical protein
MQLDERVSKRCVSPSFFAWMAAARGETGEAVRWLERAAGSRDPMFAFYRALPPAFGGSNPQVEAFLSRFGL